MSVASVNGKPKARLEHRSQGRVRVRVPKEERSSQQLHEIHQRLASNPQVRAVEINPNTGSVLVTGENTSRLQSVLSEVFTLVESVAQENRREAGVEATVQLVKRADEKLRGMSSGRLSLRALVPTVFISLGIRELFRQGLSVGTIPWYVLIYYGVDSFLKLYPNYAPQPGDEVRVS